MKQVIRITYTGNGVCDAMALLEKLIFTKRKLDDCHESRSHSRFSQITPEQVRLLLFKECDWRGRKLLFDSSTIERVVASKHDKPNVRQPEEVPCIVEVSEGFSYVYKGPAADARVLGEMIFGAVAMNYKSVSFKIHIMDDPRRLMCTKVFGVPTSRRISRERKSGASSGDLMLGSNPLNVPPREEGVSLSFSLGRGDSGICGDLSPYSSVGSTCDYFSMFNIWDGNQSQEDIYTFHSPPGRRLSNSSNGSFQRRASQNMATRFDLGSSSPKLLSVPTAASNVTSNDSQVYSNSTTSGTSDSLNSTASSSQKKNKLGLALLITVSDNDELDLVRSCVEHSPQLQALVCRLRLATLEAGAGAGFVSTLYRAGIDAAKSLSDLIYGPRLQPIWLHLVTSDRRTAVRTSETLLTDMCSVLSVGDTKHTNFFISTLLTHVLTYHLGWVSTVSPYDTVDSQNRPSDLEPGSKRPYNALWAQLSDLCGSIGFPPRIAKTIISGGNNAQFVNKLLVVLTYFVRCGEVKRNDYVYKDCDIKEAKVVNVQPKVGLKRIATQARQLGECKSQDSLQVPCSNTQNSFSSVSTLAPSDISVKRSPTLANLGEKLSLSSDCLPDCNRREDKPGLLRRNHTMLHSIKASSDSSLSSSTEEIEPEQRVLFVLGDDEKLVGLKNKSTNGKRVKKSSKVQEEPIGLEAPDKEVNKAKDRETESPSKCCGQTLQHSKPIKHSGFKFEFDKYPQIVTNYMKSKNLEILDRHYIGKPGNLKLDNFQFDPTIVPPIQEERCETCYQCQMMESLLQTPTNASEFEYMNDIPRQSEPQYAKETIVKDTDRHRELSPKNFVRKRKENTIVVNLKSPCPVKSSLSVVGCNEVRKMREKDNGVVEVKQLVEFPMPGLVSCQAAQKRSGFDSSLLGGVTDHYVPDLVLQGTLARPQSWDAELRRDLELTSYLNKTTDAGAQAVAIVGDTSTWEVSVVGRGCGAGMSSLVGAMLDALPAMRRARVPAHQCISFLEGKLRELCVLSKTLADMLMSTDFCDIATLTKSLNIDVNDVPLLLAVATTHTPQVATRYGISYR